MFAKYTYKLYRCLQLNVANIYCIHEPDRENIRCHETAYRYIPYRKLNLVVLTISLIVNIHAL